ncbi:hypothetical protein [Methylobacterium organophilum]|uniref:Lipoprotein n=1 Tax=Methylobacterium organophilum TaxID=410 RepID=A0ABQ4TCL9_METOR|nr:hypothetical protein [Methylobacterium organophilum]GJE29343.1 hypothetical protein LKMONMHP_4223 [Methylobacterium organophilum]
MSPFERASRLILLAPLCLVACAQQGDFGRPAKSAWNDLVETTGTLAAREREEPASAFPLTDDERVLRDRAWRFLMPAQGHAAFEDVLANLTRTRVLPPNWREPNVAAYHDGLLSESFRSPVSRYRRLSEDAGADGRLIPVFVATAARVIEADAFRLRSLPFARTLDDFDVRNAAMRVAENRCLIAWVRLELGQRVAQYRYALEHLAVEMPGRDAAVTEQAIGFLESRRALLAPLLPPEAAARCGLEILEPPQAALAPPVVAKY